MARTAEFLPSVMCVRVPYSKEQLDVSFELWTGQAPPNDLARSFKKSDLSKGLEKRIEAGEGYRLLDLLRPNLTYTHELIHFLQLLNYPLGLTWYRLLLNKLGSICRVLTRLQENDLQQLSPRKLPLRNWVAENSGLREDFKKLHLHCTIYERFQQLFFEKSSATIAHAKFVWRHIHTISSSSIVPHWDPITARDFRYLRSGTEDYKAVLEFPFLTTRSLIETFAVETLDQQAKILPCAGLARELQRPYLEWRDSVKMLARRLVGRPISRDLLLSAIDLALMTPCDGVTSHLVGQPVWEDVFPPIRFRRILETLSKEKILPSDENGITHTVERLCALFNWPTPSQISDCLRKVRFLFEGSKATDKAVTFVDNQTAIVNLEGYQELIAERFRKASHLRMENPNLIINLFESTERKPSAEAFYSKVLPVFSVLGNDIELVSPPADEATTRSLHYLLIFDMAQRLWEGQGLKECCNYFMSILEDVQAARETFESYIRGLYPIDWDTAMNLQSTINPDGPAEETRKNSSGPDSVRAQDLHRKGADPYLRFYWAGDSHAAYEAMRCYEKSLAIYREIGDESGIADNLGQMALIHHLWRNYVFAEKLYVECITIREQLGQMYGARNGWRNLARLYETLGLRERARWCQFASDRLRLLQWRDKDYQEIFAENLRKLEETQEWTFSGPIACPLCDEEIILPVFLSTVGIGMSDRARSTLEVCIENYEVKCQACGTWLCEEKTCPACGCLVINNWDSNLYTIEHCVECHTNLPDIESSVPALTLRAYRNL